MKHEEFLHKVAAIYGAMRAEAKRQGVDIAFSHTTASRKDFFDGGQMYRPEENRWTAEPHVLIHWQEK